jgi:hypothetical protein
MRSGGLVVAGAGDDGAAELPEQLGDGDGDESECRSFGAFEDALAGGGHDDEGVGEQADRGAGAGYGGGDSSFTRALRTRGLRPRCEVCAAAGTPAEFAIIAHPASEETQWEWVELPDPPTWWGWAETAHLPTGALPHSGSWRGALAESEAQAYLVAALHGVCERLGGLTRRWRTDRMATVCHPECPVTSKFP